jgi:hypothetical protein
MTVSWTWNFLVAKLGPRSQKIGHLVVVVLRAKISALEKPASRHIPSGGVRSGSWSPVRGWGAGWRLPRPPPRRRRMSPGTGRRGAGTSPYEAKLSWVSCSVSDPHCNENPIYEFPEKEIARPQSQFPHSGVCEWFIYYQDRSTFIWDSHRPFICNADWIQMTHKKQKNF